MTKGPLFPRPKPNPRPKNINEMNSIKKLPPTKRYKFQNQDLSIHATVHQTGYIDLSFSAKGESEAALCMVTLKVNELKDISNALNEIVGDNQGDQTTS